MNKMKKYILLISIITILLCVNYVSANENISDLTSDLYHHYLNEATTNYEWKMATDNLPNIDIIGLSFTTTDSIATIKIKVKGEIENSTYITYFISYSSVDINYREF